MQPPISYKVRKQNLWISGERSVFWDDQKTLIVSDLHFGKTGHFRKSGIAVPQHIYREDLQRLVNLLHYFQPQHLIVVGDFFHSHENIELELFKKWRNDFSSLPISLVKGNHDILKQPWYHNSGISLIDNELSQDPFYFTHEICTDHSEFYTFCGHIHPGIIIHGAGRQSLRFPCFVFSQNHCILPAFSRFTGMSIIEKGDNDVFAIVENKLVQI